MVLIVRGLQVVARGRIGRVEGHPKGSDDVKLAFGAKVRECRHAKGLSQEGLATACGLDRSYIGGVERGQRNVSLINIYKIAQALAVSPKCLLR